MIPQDKLQLNQAEMQLRSKVRRSKQHSKNRLNKTQPRSFNEQLQSTRATILTLLKSKMAQANTDSRAFCWLLAAYLKLDQKQFDIPTFKEFFAALPREEEDEPIQIRDPLAADPTPTLGEKE